jgi:TRAP transporter 4TM/12TM fusion protein
MADKPATHPDPGPTSEQEAARLAEQKFDQRYRKLSPPWQLVMLLLTLTVCVLAINQIFNLGFLVGHVILDARYLFIYVAIILVMTFIFFPLSRRTAGRGMRWYDLVLIAVTIAVFGYFAYHADRIVLRGWEFAAPEYATYMALVAWIIVLEAGRRAGGMPIFVVTLLISLYPVVAEHLPTVVAGAGKGLLETAAFHMFSTESVFGLPTQVGALLVFGFLLFGVALQYTGAGKFFIDLSLALLGRHRGGPAKVAILSSGFMASMSGGPVINVLTSGPFTIPAMCRVGFSRTYAAGVEANASTGGVLMPPIMGATAFVMATFLGVSYTTVMIAALIPALLFFFGLFIQIDAYSARHGIKGLPAAEIPRAWPVLLSGWHYIAILALLVWMLIYLQREATAPFYATLILLIVNQFTRNRLSWKQFIDFIKGIGNILAELGGILAAVGLIIGALQGTGMAGTITNDLIFLAGGSVLMLLLMGALTSFVLGMGLTVTAAYVLLAIILAPALIRAGVDPLAAHMFIMYWGMLSFITPPVAIAAFVAASVARCSPMQTSLQAMLLGTVIYFIPFFFVFNPALLMQGAWTEVFLVLITALVGIAILANGLQGYLLGIGSLGSGPPGWLARGLLIGGGLLLATPGGGMLGIGHTTLIGVAAVLVALGALIGKLRLRQAVHRPAAP